MAAKVSYALFLSSLPRALALRLLPSCRPAPSRFFLFSLLCSHLLMADDCDTNDDRLASTSELTYPSGISLLSLKNHLLLSYLHHLVALFALKLNSKSISTSSGAQVVQGLVKLRVVLEKIGPLEGKLKYQIEKLVRKADQAAEGDNDEEVANGMFRFRLSHCRLPSYMRIGCTDH